MANRILFPETGYFVVVLLILVLTAGMESKAIGKRSELSNEIEISSVDKPTLTTTKRPNVKETTTEAVSIDPQHVTLRLPDELFASSANLTLRLRDLIGQLILRSTARMAKLIRFIQPLFGKDLVIEIPKDLD